MNGADRERPVVTHLNPEGMHQNPAYSQGVVVEAPARTVYVGGQNAVSPEGQVLGVGDLAAQTELALQNLATVLAAAGARLQDVVKLTVLRRAGAGLPGGVRRLPACLGRRTAARRQRRPGVRAGPPGLPGGDRGRRHPPRRRPAEGALTCPPARGQA